MARNNIETYLELLKKVILNEIYLDNELRIQYLGEQLLSKRKLFQKASINYQTLHHITSAFPEKHSALQEGRKLGKHLENNIQHLVYAHSMIGRKRMDNIHDCLNLIIENNIAGDLIECGVWQGGSTILMNGFLKAHDIKNRRVWVADSFEGLPKPSREEDKLMDVSKDVVPGLAVSLEQVKANFEKYDLLDDNIHFLKGWFKDTLHQAPIQKLALLRLDGDLYESTMDILNALYTKVVSGGFIIVDDYELTPCKKAITDFRAQQQITDPIIPIDWMGIYWQKS